ncbi:hypothetical protein [Streptomonospora wellingtoniae]|uniref:Uncharacterized protein n=1 Tax=Streptomonospora wellingtoniae TaxID=3075544 RepID=A0ABU2KW70_9ACTN|nr:hypothetical protein [Streptomonospora sp. DSM 45055]MDT0303545.1 hypothetical protein [Streptomonospora sp. DSM 45055]
MMIPENDLADVGSVLGDGWTASAETTGTMVAVLEGRWRVWRSVDERGRHAAWCATNLDPASDRVPTLHATTLVGLARQLDNPPQAVGLGPSPEALAVHAAGLRP